MMKMRFAGFRYSLFAIHNSPRQRRGTVLALVLWVSLGLVSVALLFGHSMVLEYRASENALAGLEAEQALEGARRYVRYLLANLEEPGRLPEIETYEAEGVSIGDAKFWLLGRGAGLTEEVEQIFGLTDEAAKLNLNTATREMLEALPGMTAELAAAIVDWRDTDQEVSPDGAESETYLLRDHQYNCKDSAFETIEELRLVVGGDWDVLFGEDANLNGVLDPNENDGAASRPGDDADGKLDPGILEYVTVYSREPNKQEDGEDRINVTNGQDPALGALLQGAFGQERANQIQAAAGDTQSVRSVLEYFSRSRMTAQEFQQVADALTVSDEDYLPGLVNVNTASAAVLACIPGIGDEFAQQLVDHREGVSSDLDSVAWVAELLGQENATQAGPFLTARTWQYSADVAAVGSNGRGFRRAFFVFDLANIEDPEAPPVTIYRRDRSDLGWPLGSVVRQELAQGKNEVKQKRFE